MSSDLDRKKLCRWVRPMMGLGFWALFLFSILFIANHAVAQVVIDPGHGGKDGGTFWRSMKESGLSLKIAQLLETELHAAGVKETILTRDHDEFISLSDRVEKSRTGKKVFFLSLHVNSHPSPRVHGFEIYSAFPRAETTAPSSSLAFILQDLRKKGRSQLETKWEENLEGMWHSTFPNESFRIKQAPFYVLEHTDSPSLLIEIGFLTNAEDRAKFKDDHFQNQLAHVLAEAVAQLWTMQPEAPTLSGKKILESDHASYHAAN